MIYRCCDTRRRDRVAAHATLNGIDWLEVIDRALPEFDPLRQRTLLVHCLKPLPAGFSAANLQLLGGERVTNIEIDWAVVAAPLPAQLAGAAAQPTREQVQAIADAPSTLVIRTRVTGDFSTYTLRFVAGPLDDAPPANFDPCMRDIEFSFKVECPTEFDCGPAADCTPQPAPSPALDYLARDYAGFRRMLLDWMATQAPQWQPDSIADGGIALIELLAYAGDQLSYRQDAIGTEAYLHTARKRISLRRHAQLVDYTMHEGCNARAWLQLDIAQASYDLPLSGTRFLTRCPGLPTGLALGSPQLDVAMQMHPTVYEPLLVPQYAPLYVQRLYAAHNRLSFHTWSDTRCHLPAGSTQATLRGHHPDLKPGDVLLFEEVLGPRSGVAGDADPAHRQVVRLTQVDAALLDPLDSTPLTGIRWAAGDALPFALCLSSVTDEAHGGRTLDEVSIARGNLVLVDHGETLNPEDLGAVPLSRLSMAPGCASDCCDTPPPAAVPPRYQPRLAQNPLTQAVGRYVEHGGKCGTAPLHAGIDSAASSLLDSTPSEALPQLLLSSSLDGITQGWHAQRTLLDSEADAADFVVEVDEAGRAQLRFGDDRNGLRPASRTAFSARYRIGNGSAGNVGADRIVHFVGDNGDLPFVLAVRNPLPARGGIDPETAEEVRRNAPQAFRTQQRAVTTDDYAEVTERLPQVQRAAASLRWTGSWYTACVSADALVGADAAALDAALPDYLDRYRMAGHDLRIDPPRPVSLEIELHVCVKDGYFRSEVRKALLRELGTGLLADGRRALFHPDNFSFGQSVYLSPVYAAAHAVPGVASVEARCFQRQGQPDPAPLLSGELKLGRLEIARLDNDRNFPERGVLRLDIHGGQ